MNLITHMYSEEEAEILQYLTPWASKSAEKLANRPVGEVKTILEKISGFQDSLLTFGEGDSMKYNILPILPGAFEFALIKPDESCLTEWHLEFARLIAKLYNDGAFSIYGEDPEAWGMVRYILVYSTIRHNPSALPSDKLPEILDRYQDLAVGLCQCTTTAKAMGTYCGRPHLTCMTMGSLARRSIDAGISRRIEVQEALEIKLKAQEFGLSTWMQNFDDDNFDFNISCSCCGDCCMALRTVT